MCLSPVSINGRVSKSTGIVEGSQQVPCGKCPQCKLRKANDWVIRITEEAKTHACVYFVTLTYDNSHVKKLAYQTPKRAGYNG